MNTATSPYEADAQTAGAIIELLVEEGFIPSDDNYDGNGLSIPAWIAQRYDAVRPEADGWTCAKWSDDGIQLYLMTTNGVPNSMARFSFNELGVKMLAGALGAIS